jgi:sulfonate transport system permease protein
LTGLVVALFSMPIIAAAPVLAIAFDVGTAKVLLAALVVFFPPLINTLVGLRSVDRSLVDVIHAYGGNDWTVLRRARARAAVPGILVGLRIAAPAALLGAILGEYLGGEKGLGVFMLNSLAQFETARTWGAGLVSTALAGTAFAAFLLLGRRFATAAAPTIGVGAAARPRRDVSGVRRLWVPLLDVVVAVVVVLGAWYGFVVLLALDPLFAKTPTDMARFFLHSDEAGRVWDALETTAPLAAIGLICGLATAMAGAILFVLVPSVERTVMPLALTLQSIPLVAMAPILVLLLGRGTLVSIVITVLVTFFPSLVTLTAGLRSAPRGAIDLLATYDASAWTVMRKVRLPHAFPYVLAAARLVAPLALLGVMISEWLATGTGLGGDLQNSRFLLDFDVVWAEATVATAFAVATYVIVGMLEGRAMRRFAPHMTAI